MTIQPYLILLLLWILYFAVHSLLAATSVKNLFRRLLKHNFRYYRLCYVIFSVLTLLPVLYYNALVSSKLVLPADKLEIARYAGMIIATYGVIVVRRAFKAFSIRNFLGVNFSEHTATEPLRTEGLLGHIRHPLYAGTLLIFTGFWLFSPTIANAIMVGVIFVYVLIGIQLEEKKLLEIYGKQYKIYKTQVPMLIPFFKKKAH